MSLPNDLQHLLDEPFTVTPKQVAFFQQNGYIKIKEVLSPALVSYMKETISNEVKRLNTQDLPMDQRDTYGKAFLQVMNIWTHSQPVKEIVFSKRLAKIAADLMQVNGVRLYHDQALYKEPGGGHTPWHADQYYWPLATDKTVTAWIPLQDVPFELGPLEYSAQSQQLTEGRNLKISDESQQQLEDKLVHAGFKHVVEAFETGEVSFHKGWLFHRAGPNKTNTMRSAMTMIYMDKDMTLKTPENDNQINDWNTWCPGAKIGEIINTPINPVLYEQ